MEKWFYHFCIDCISYQVKILNMLFGTRCEEDKKIYTNKTVGQEV